MKKIYSFIQNRVVVASLSMLLLATGTFAQPICGPIVENFNNNSGSTRGFTGDFIAGTTGQNGYLIKTNVIATATYTVTTPTYKLAANATSIGYGFILEGTQRVARVETSIIFVSTLNGQLTTVFLSQFVPTYNQNGQDADVCRAIATSDLPGFPTGGSYRLRIELTPNTGNGTITSTLTFDDFRTNGTLAQAALPVNFIGFDAKKTSAGLQLTWKVAGEENVARYEVERSADGRSFTTIGSTAVSGKDTYSYLDALNSSTIYYRIKNVDNDGKFKYSTIARIANGKLAIVLKAFPLPVQNQLTVQHPPIDGNGLLTISTADGRVVKSIKPSARSMQTYVDMATLQKGIYLLRFESGDGTAETMKVIKQ